MTIEQQGRAKVLSVSRFHLFNFVAAGAWPFRKKRLPGLHRQSLKSRDKILGQLRNCEL
jgi:hypothetical protein